MAKSITITLAEPIVWFDKRIETLVLQHPTGADYMELGEPRFPVRMADGGYWVDKDDVIGRYIGRLLTIDGVSKVDGGDAIFRAMSLPDVIAIKEALIGFFTAAREAISA